MLWRHCARTVVNVGTHLQHPSIDIYNLLNLYGDSPSWVTRFSDILAIATTATDNVDYILYLTGDVACYLHSSTAPECKAPRSTPTPASIKSLHSPQFARFQRVSLGFLSFPKILLLSKIVRIFSLAVYL